MSRVVWLLGSVVIVVVTTVVHLAGHGTPDPAPQVTPPVPGQCVMVRFVEEYERTHGGAFPPDDVFDAEYHRRGCS